MKKSQEAKASASKERERFEQSLARANSLLAQPAATSIAVSTPNGLSFMNTKDLLAHPDIALPIPGSRGQTSLHRLAQHGCTEVVSHPQAATVRDDDGNTPLHELARKLVPETIGHPMAATVRNNMSMTPLHILAGRGVAKVLEHPDVGNVADKYGITPLRLLYWKGNIEAKKRLEQLEAKKEIER